MTNRPGSGARSKQRRARRRLPGGRARPTSLARVARALAYVTGTIDRPTHGVKPKEEGELTMPGTTRKPARRRAQPRRRREPRRILNCLSSRDTERDWRFED